MIEKYSIVTCTDGNFSVRSEWGNATGAIKAFHKLAESLWNDASFSEGYIAILDSQLDVFEGRKERISHEVVSVPEENVEE